MQKYTRIPNFATRKPATVEKGKNGISLCKMERDIFSRGAKSDASYVLKHFIFLVIPPHSYPLWGALLSKSQPTNK